MHKRHIAWAAFALGLGSAEPCPAETLAVFTKSQSNPVARAIRTGSDTAAKTLALQVFHYIPTTPDNVAQQSALIDEVIRSKPDAVVLMPVDAKALVPAVEKLNAAGLPLINVSERLAGGSVVAYVGTDDYRLALATARVLLKAMGGKGNVVILEGPAGVHSSAERVRGYQDAIKEFPDVKLAASKPANYQRQQAVQVMKDLLRASPQIDGVLAANDPMAAGAIEALKGTNRKALVVGINASKEAVELIKAGDLLASGDYSGFIEGCLGVEIAARHLRRQDTPKEIMIKPVVVEKSNSAAYDIPIERRVCPSLDGVAAN
jgi:ribose transport system substrate-binding protein